MRRTVTIQTMASTPDGGGGFTEAAVVVAANVPARIEPLDGREQMEAMATGMVKPHRITIRYRPGLTGATQLLYDTRTFDIKSIVDPEEKHRELHILAEDLGVPAPVEGLPDLGQFEDWQFA